MVTDWRGTEITEGALVVYGGPVGRSIQQVEGRVAGFTSGGRVNVEIIRRSYTGASSYGKKIVHVGPDRLTIVTGLPPTELPEWGVEVDAAKAEADERKRIQDTHDIQEFEEIRPGTTYPWRTWKCTRCGKGYYEAGQKECGGS